MSARSSSKLKTSSIRADFKMTRTFPSPAKLSSLFSRRIMTHPNRTRMITYLPKTNLIRPTWPLRSLILRLKYKSPTSARDLKKLSLLLLRRSRLKFSRKKKLRRSKRLSLLNMKYPQTKKKKSCQSTQSKRKRSHQKMTTNRSPKLTLSQKAGKKRLSLKRMNRKTISGITKLHTSEYNS